MTSQLSFSKNHNPESCFLRLAVLWSQKSKIICDLLKNKQIKCISQHLWNLSVSIETKCKWLFVSVNNIDITLFISSTDMPLSPFSGPTSLRYGAKLCNSQVLRRALRPCSWKVCLGRGLPPHSGPAFNPLQDHHLLCCTFWDRNLAMNGYEWIFQQNPTKNQVWDECKVGAAVRKHVLKSDYIKGICVSKYIMRPDIFTFFLTLKVQGSQEDKTRHFGQTVLKAHQDRLLRSTSQHDHLS